MNHEMLKRGIDFKHVEILKLYPFNGILVEVFVNVFGTFAGYFWNLRMYFPKSFITPSYAHVRPHASIFFYVYLYSVFYLPVNIVNMVIV